MPCPDEDAELQHQEMWVQGVRWWQGFLEPRLRAYCIYLYLCWWQQLRDDWGWESRATWWGKDRVSWAFDLIDP